MLKTQEAHSEIKMNGEKTWNVFCFNGAEKNNMENCRQQITAGFGWQRNLGVMHFLVSHYASFCIQLDTNTGYRARPNKCLISRLNMYLWCSEIMALDWSAVIVLMNGTIWWSPESFLKQSISEQQWTQQQALSKCRYVLFTHLSSWPHKQRITIFSVNFFCPSPSCLGYEQVLNVQPPKGGCETPCLVLSATGQRAICLSHLLLLGP